MGIGRSSSHQCHGRIICANRHHIQLSIIPKPELRAFWGTKTTTWGNLILPQNYILGTFAKWFSIRFLKMAKQYKPLFFLLCDAVFSHWNSWFWNLAYSGLHMLTQTCRKVSALMITGVIKIQVKAIPPMCFFFKLFSPDSKTTVDRPVKAHSVPFSNRLQVTYFSIFSMFFCCMCRVG